MCIRDRYQRRVHGQEAAPGESSLGYSKPSMQMDHTMDGKFEETFPDVIKFMESNYRVKAEKSGRAIAGLSMGGYHSLHISRFYPNTFDYVGLFSAAIMSNDKATSEVYKNFDATLETQMKNGYKLYWIGIGKADFLYKANEEYRAKLDKMGMKYTYVETEGGHTWTNWRVYLSEFAPLLFKQNFLTQRTLSLSQRAAKQNIKTLRFFAKFLCESLRQSC
eukprot:TRINITY_DN17111_c0_g1_i1.p1 TRINITY_DN17111_c0_g1~~TRINITY_DN17111_c0_g1_i1.p1  ORF type:complete len:220 (+),score=4.72 TRINITY_DN17111_c0_g1_i1:129-788(+)